MDLSEFIATLISGGGALSLLSYRAGKRKTSAEIKKLEEERKKLEEDTEAVRISNLRGTIDIYRQVHDELAEQLRVVSNKCTQLSNEISNLRRENKTLTEKIMAASEENKLLKQELHDFKEKFQIK